MNIICGKHLLPSTTTVLLRASYHAQSGGAYGHRHNIISAQRPDETIRNLNLNEPTSQSFICLQTFVDAYRRHGYRCAKVDPLELKSCFVERENEIHELQSSRYHIQSISSQDVNTILGTKQRIADVRQLSEYMKHMYCNTITTEFMHITNAIERQWFATEYERIVNEKISDDDKRTYARLMRSSQDFDHFLGLKFATVKRYGGEGAEGMMAFFHELIQTSPECDVAEMMICMAHRGRLCLLTSMLNFDPAIMFAKMRGQLEFAQETNGLGDVLSHLATSVDIAGKDGRKVHVCLLPNPSHLEAVNAVCAGKVRGRLQTLQRGDYANNDENTGNAAVLCVQIHGDAAFSGQGIVPETLAISQSPQFRVGGSIHLVTNNQIGYTAEASYGRSSRHVTDVAKAIDSPIIHVNGEEPEQLARATRLSMRYRRLFGKDVFINMICYRRHGHNELDDPTFTQPLMYEKIHKLKTAPDAYAQRLIDEGTLKQDQLDKWTTENKDYLTSRLQATNEIKPRVTHFLSPAWSDIKVAPNAICAWDTGIDINTLKYVGVASVTAPKDMTHIEARIKRVNEGNSIDWSTAEALAFGTLMLQGYNVRICGQDVGRGTFSQRHCMLVDQKDDSVYVPLNNMASEEKNVGKLEVANSILSEEAVLGFEYGMSIEHPKRLCIWEAQFGDFFNGAQIIIDTFIGSGEAKWLLHNSLVMVLPHGFDGAGPEHSSCRMERFLQLTDSTESQVDSDRVNMHIVNPTTPAQYFHSLRAQMLRPYRKPLIIVGPKVLLRHPSATSSLADMTTGTHFQHVITDTHNNAAGVKKVILCTGKHYYTLRKHLDTQPNLASEYGLIRVECLAPFPTKDIQTALDTFPNAKKHIWSQEEAQNMGAWSFVAPRLQNLCGINPIYVGRSSSAIVATAISSVHNAEAAQILTQTFQS